MHAELIAQIVKSNSKLQDQSLFYEIAVVNAYLSKEP